MPITFNSIDDPYGIRNAGSVLGQALMQRNMENLQNQRQLEREQRLDTRNMAQEERDLQRQLAEEKRKRDMLMQGQQGALSGLNLLDENLSPQSQLAYLNSLGQNGGDLSSGLDILKQLTTEKIAGLRTQGKAQPKSILDKKQEEAAANFVINTRQKAAQADQFLREVPELEKAINSPELADQWFTTRLFKGQAQKLPGGGALLNPQEQTISTFSKRMVTDLTDLKGIRLTDPKLRWLQGAVVEVGKSPEANARALEIAKDLYKINSMSGPIMDQIIEENGGEVPYNIETLVGQRIGDVVDKYIEQQPDYQASASNKQAQSFESLPSAKEYKGKKIKDKDSGVIYQSDGTRWTKVK